MRIHTGVKFQVGSGGTHTHTHTHAHMYTCTKTHTERESAHNATQTTHGTTQLQSDEEAALSCGQSMVELRQGRTLRTREGQVHQFLTEGVITPAHQQQRHIPQGTETHTQQ